MQSLNFIFSQYCFLKVNTKPQISISMSSGKAREHSLRGFVFPHTSGVIRLCDQL